jgi:hypothetical protein
VKPVIRLSPRTHRKVPGRVASLISYGMAEHTPRGRIRDCAEGFPVLAAELAAQYFAA